MRHEKKPAEASIPNGSDQDRPQSSDDLEGEEEVEDFFSGKGFLNNNGFVQEERNTLNPSEAHNHIKVYLRKNYHFQKSVYIQGFVKILASVNDQNKAWVRLSCLIMFFVAHFTERFYWDLYQNSSDTQVSRRLSYHPRVLIFALGLLGYARQC